MLARNFEDLRASIFTLSSLPELGRYTLTDVAAGFAESWIQVAATGEDFQRADIGRFSITSEMLREMAANFNDGRWPIPPTSLIADYEHGSAIADGPETGKAAGTVKKLELRESDSELWALVEWTPAATQAIRDREYRCISPEFHRAFTTPTGDKIGCALLAIAITNRPFLQGMDPVSIPARLVAHVEACARKTMVTHGDELLRLTAETRRRHPDMSEEDAIAKVFSERPELYERYRAGAVPIGSVLATTRS